MKNNLPIKYKKSTNNVLKTFEIVVGNVPVIGTTIAPIIGIANDKLAEGRIIYLIDKLNQSEINFQEISKYDTSLWNIIQVFNTIIRVRQKEKIEHFINLVTNGYNSKIIFEDSDFFEEYIKILEKITIEDILILKLLKENYTPINQYAKEEDLRGMSTKLKECISIISKQISKTDEYVIAILDKLVGYGLCSKKTYHSFTFGINQTNDEYKVSPIYEKLEELIINKN